MKIGREIKREGEKRIWREKVKEEKSKKNGTVERMFVLAF